MERNREWRHRLGYFRQRMGAWVVGLGGGIGRGVREMGVDPGLTAVILALKMIIASFKCYSGGGWRRGGRREYCGGT